MDTKDYLELVAELLEKDADFGVKWIARNNRDFVWHLKEAIRCMDVCLEFSKISDKAFEIEENNGKWELLISDHKVEIPEDSAKAMQYILGTDIWHIRNESGKN